MENGEFTSKIYPWGIVLFLRYKDKTHIFQLLVALCQKALETPSFDHFPSCWDWNRYQNGGFSSYFGGP